MSEQKPAFFAVRGEWQSSSFTFLCPDAATALTKLHAFRHSQYANITVTAPDGGVLTEDDLERLIRQGETPEGGAPVDIDAPTAPALAA